MPQLKLQNGPQVMLQQHAERMKYKNDVFVTLHCPPPYSACSAIDIKEGQGRIPPATKK